MSSELRDKAERALQQYVLETLEYIFAALTFIGGQTWSDWRLERKAELSTLKDITKPGNKGEQQKMLDAVLKNTVEGMEKLTDFLDAVEKLAVTSLLVFTGGEEVVELSLGICLDSVKDIISAARLVCPLLLQFKRDARVFFQPSLRNVAVFVAELDKYIDTAEKIFTVMETSSAIGFEDNLDKPLVQFAKDLKSDVMQNIIAHVDQLSDIRKDQNFRLVYLFQEKSVLGFVIQFSEIHPRMLQFLDDLEGCAVQLDRMKTGAEISNVAGSSVGILGGLMVILGGVLAPVTAGLSLGLTIGGLGLGITSGVNGVVTTITEIAVNENQKKRASEDLERFMQDVDRIQGCLDEVTNQREEILGVDYWALAKVVRKVVFGVGGIGKKVRRISNLTIASETTEKAQQAAKVTRAVSKMAASIAFDSLFIGMDIFTICKDGGSLARGDKSEVSEFIRARASLLRSEVDCWKRIHDSVCCIGEQKLESGKHVLEMPF